MNNISSNNNWRPHGTKREAKNEIYRIDPQKLRYAQSSMKDETRDGLAIPELVKIMKSSGYDNNYPIRVVHMPAGQNDSPNEKLVSFDTRRTKAARQADRELENTKFYALAKIQHYNDLAEEEYTSLKHLTFYNKKIPRYIRSEWILAWDEWHEKDRLEEAGIKPRTWGHLVKLRMAMSMDRKRSFHADNHNGFKESPFVRVTKKNPRVNLRARKLTFK